MNAATETPLRTYYTNDLEAVQRFHVEHGAGVPEDGVDFRNWHPSPVDGYLVVEPFMNDPVPAWAGLTRCRAATTNTLEIHPLIPAGARRRRHQLMDAMLEHIFGRSHISKTFSLIPVTLPHVVRFAVEMGMAREGRLTDSCYRDGQAVDQWVMGMTAEQWRAARGRHR